MADVLPSVLVTSVMSKLYDILTNGDDTVPKSDDHFFSWATPGIPMDPSDFDFLTQGFSGVVKKADLDVVTGAGSAGAGGTAGAGGAGATPPEITPAMLDQLRAQDTNRLYQKAEAFARLCDVVVDVTKTNNDQFARLNVLNNEGSLSDVYRYTLRMSQVMQSELPEETKQKIAKFRALLTTTVTKKNLIDDTETQVSEPSELTRTYNEKLAAYEAAALEYNTRRIAAMSASTPEDVHYWALNASILRNRVKAAMDDWVSNGYKNDYEQIAAFIDQVMQRDMSLLKQEYRDDLEKARITGLASGSDFFYTSLVPASFATSTGWSRFRFTSSDFSSHTSSNVSTKKWNTSAGASWLGIFGGKGGGGSSSASSEYHGTFDSDTFELSFEIAQVPIVMSWLHESFLKSHAWRFDPSSPDSTGQVISDGKTPPSGLIPAYPTMAIFVRGLTMKIGHSEGFSDFVTQSTSSQAGGGGFLNIGPFFGGGSYDRQTSSGSTKIDHGVKFDGQELSFEGMQLAGFKCFVHTDLMPNPSPTITSWI